VSDHEHIEELLAEHLDGTLSPGERERVERHLESCPRCAGTAEAYRSILEGYRALADDDVGPGVSERVRRIAREALTDRRRPSRAWLLLPAAAAALAAVVWLAAHQGTSVAEHLQAAEQHWDAGQLEAARAEYERALELADGGTGEAAALHGLARLQLQLGEPARARSALDGVIEHHPEYPELRDVLVLRAEALEALGEVGLAVLAYDRVAREYGDREAARRASDLRIASDDVLGELRALGYVE
jgi:tetratricopeptide (TPR) repeat protein